MYFLDLDDFCEENTDWKLLTDLKKWIPNIKFNLFTIPGLCSDSFLKEMRKVEWIQMIPHGYSHDSSRECEKWSYYRTMDWLIALEHGGWIRGWKSPGWQISEGTYKALLDRNWWVADQEYNNDRRPKNLRAYLLDSSNKIHGHIGHWGKGVYNENSLENLFDYIGNLEGEFGFIDDLWK